MFRQVETEIRKLLDGKNPPIVLILGLRQVGKTTLAQKLCQGREIVRFNFDLPSERSHFIKQDRYSLAEFAARHEGKIVIIDEIQKLPEATAVVKYLFDSHRMRFILTGSSEIKIRKGIGDSLVGRIHEVRLYPLSLTEIDVQSGLPFDKDAEYNNYEFNQQHIFTYLVYGSLPQLLNISPDQHEDYLRDYMNNLFSRDILEIAATRKPAQIYQLAKSLALQIGQLVNFNELAGLCEISRVTVVNYIDILEQMGLVTRAVPISSNQREAISKRCKIYFTDLGTRNALVGNFGNFRDRPDSGQLLENAVFMGFKRRNDYLKERAEIGFFRSPHGAEIDIVKKTSGAESLYEVKLSGKMLRKARGVEIISLQNAQKYLY